MPARRRRTGCWRRGWPRAASPAAPTCSNARKGFAATHGPDFHPEAALADPPGGWYLRGNLFKYHAACYLTHAPIECARTIAARPGFAADAVREAVLHIDRGADTVCNIAVPRTGLEAKFSLRLTVALALAGIDTASLATYSEAHCGEPRLVALRDKLRIVFEDGWPSSRAALRGDAAPMADVSRRATIPAFPPPTSRRRDGASRRSFSASPCPSSARRARAALDDAVGALDERAFDGGD